MRWAALASVVVLLSGCASKPSADRSGAHLHEGPDDGATCMQVNVTVDNQGRSDAVPVDASRWTIHVRVDPANESVRLLTPLWVLGPSSVDAGGVAEVGLVYILPFSDAHFSGVFLQVGGGNR